MNSRILSHILRRDLVPFVIALSLVLTGCKKQENLSEGTRNVFEAIVPEDSTMMEVDSLDTEMRTQLESEIVLQRVEEIYNVVKSEFRRRGSAVEDELLDKAYCSQDWNKLLLAVRYKEHLTGTMFFEINHWSMTTDTELVSFEEFEVSDLYVSGQEKYATVRFTVYEADTWTPAKLDMVYENGQWLIDNFHNLKYLIDVKQRMWDYLQNDNLM